MKRQYTIDHFETASTLVIEIDTDFLQIGKTIVELVEFWTGYQERLDENEGNHLHTFLKQITEQCIRVAATYNYNEKGLIDYFAEAEGYCKMDGSNGIKIIRFSPPELDNQYEYRITMKRA